MTNPLISSFLLSWVIANWEISVALLWYDPKQLEDHSIFSFIRCRIWWWPSFVLPLALSLVYTFLVPIARNWIHMFQAWNNKWGKRKVFKISEESSVSFNYFMQTKNQVEEQKKRLAAAIEEQKTIRADLEVANALLKKTQDEKHAFELENSDLKLFRSSYDNYDIVKGRWNLTSNTGDNRNIEIASNNLYYLDQYNKRVEPKYTIANLFYDYTNRKIVFTVFNQTNMVGDNRYEVSVYDLDYQKDLMIGVENQGKDVRFQRID